jgi:cobalt-zinc-cadmium efflux system outer membrane protein
MLGTAPRSGLSGEGCPRAARAPWTPGAILLLLSFTLALGCKGGIAYYEPASLPLPGDRPEPIGELPPLPEYAPPRPAAVPRKPALTLEEAVTEALAQAPDLLAGSEAVIQARADLKTASLYPNPTLAVGTTLQAGPGTTYSAANPGGPPQYTVDLGVQLDPLLFGKFGAAKESARRAVDVAGADFADLKRQRSGDVASGFFDVLAAKSLLALVRVDLEDLKRVEGLTRKRVDLGGAPAVDFDRARLAVALGTQDVRTAETLDLAARAALRSLLGRVGAEPAFDVVGSLEIPSPQEPPNLEVVLGTAEQVRPDVVSLRRQVERWLAEGRSQSLQGLPQLSVTGGYLYQYQTPVGLKNLNEWEASLGVTIPLFDRNQGNIAKAESQARQASLSLDAKRAAVRAELAQDIDGFRAAYAAVIAEDKTQLDLARTVRDRMEAAYQAGGRTVLEVLDAERSYRDAQRLHIAVQSAYWHALHQINTAAGKVVLK